MKNILNFNRIEKEAIKNIINDKKALNEIVTDCIDFVTQTDHTLKYEYLEIKYYLLDKYFKFNSSSEFKLEDIKKLIFEYISLSSEYIQTYAEFDNFKKRVDKEKENLINTIKFNTISDIICILDDIKRGKELSQSEIELSGLNLIYKKIDDFLIKNKIERMQSNEYNSEQHEVISMIDTGEENKGKIISVLEDGYLIDNKILKHAKVVIGA